MNKILAALKLYALSLVFAFGLYLALAPNNWAWIADGQDIPAPLLIGTLLSALTGIGSLSFVFFLVFAGLGLAVDFLSRSQAQARDEHLDQSGVAGKRLQGSDRA